MAKYTGRYGAFRIGSTGVPPVVYTDVAQIASIGSVAITADEVEVTTLDNTSGFKEYLQTFKDAGELPLSLVWDPSLPTHGDAVGGLWDLFESGAVVPMEIEFPIKPTAYVAHFNGFVKTFPTPAMTPADALIAEVSIRVAGTVTLEVKGALMEDEGAGGLSRGGSPADLTPEEKQWQRDNPGVPLPPRQSQLPRRNPSYPNPQPTPRGNAPVTLEKESLVEVNA